MFIQPKRLRGKAIELPIPLCVIDKHVPDRNAAKWDGQHYVSHCLNCGKRVRRKSRNNWRVDWLENS